MKPCPMVLGLLAGALSVFAAPPVFADIGPLALGDFSFGFFPPHAVDVPSLPAGQTIHGLRLVGDWTASTPDAWSAFARMFATSPADGNSSALDYGGVANANPLHFDASRYLAFTGGAASGGDWRFSFSSTIFGTTANFANVEVTLLDNPVVSYSGQTTGAPLWNRPRTGFDGISPFGPVRYHVQPFTVDTTGRYDIFSQFAPLGYDGFLLLYADSFDPLDPLSNGLAENDDGRTGENSADIWRDRFGDPLVLETQRTYYLVTTGFEAGEEGAFTNYIGGVGNVTFVPEPATGSAMLLGALLLTSTRHRIRKPSRARKEADNA